MVGDSLLHRWDGLWVGLAVQEATAARPHQALQVPLAGAVDAKIAVQVHVATAQQTRQLVWRRERRQDTEV